MRAHAREKKMSDVFDAYRRTRARIIALVTAAPGSALDRPVPACPEWTVADLMGHVVSMPAAIAQGARPPGSVGAWLQDLVDSRRGQSPAQLAEEWLALDSAIEVLLDGPAGVLFGDLAVHEHDFRGALEMPDHEALEVAIVLPRTLAGFARPLREANLGSITVEAPDGTWASHAEEPGWRLRIGPWEAVRAVNSRRTADELRSLPHEGDIEPYLPVLDAHLPLPLASLGET
jgi:hypothetical protein